MIIDKSTIKTGLNIFIPAVLASCFIGIFFFTYAKNVERDIVVNNVNYLVDDFMDNINLLPDPALHAIQEKINQTNLKDMSKEDKEVDESNHKLLKQVMVLIPSVLGISAAIFAGLAYWYDFSWNEVGEIIVSSLLLLLCIAVVEYLFLSIVARNYISADPNTIKHKAVTELIKVRGPRMNKDMAISHLDKYIPTEHKDIVKQTITSGTIPPHIMKELNTENIKKAIASGTVPPHIMKQVVSSGTVPPHVMNQIKPNNNVASMLDDGQKMLASLDSINTTTYNISLSGDNIAPIASNFNYVTNAHVLSTY